MADNSETFMLLDTSMPGEGRLSMIESTLEDFELDGWVPPEDRGAELEEPIPSYIEELKSAASEQTMILGQIDVRALEQNEAEQSKKKRSAEVRDHESLKEKYQELWQQRTNSKKHLADSFDQREKALKAKMLYMKGNSQRRKNQITEAFGRVHKVLRDNVKARYGETATKMGTLSERNEWLPETRLRSQEVEVRLDLARSIKDKLPCAFYVILITLWDRLGGNPIELSRHQRVSNPKRHNGRFYNSTLRIEQSLFLQLPGKLHAPMCICFEMFILKNSSFPSDRVVAHGFFPIVDSDFELLRGKFKVPLLRGPVDKSIDKYSSLSRKMQHNVDAWLCNLYFQIYADDAPIYAPLRLPEQFEEHAYSVTRPDGLKSQQASRRKAEYLITEATADLRMSGIKHYETWVSVILIVLMAWLSRFTHYFGQWWYITACGVEVTKFHPEWLTFNLRYASDTSLGFQAGLILMGSLFSISIFALLCLGAYLSVRRFGRFPNIVYRGLAYFGIMILFDWLMTLFESLVWGLATSNWNGDSFILFIYFQSQAQSPAVGVILTFLLYASLSALVGFILYNYFLKLHMHGRILDLYLRLTAPESAFYLPYDSEVSLRYLQWVVEKSLTYTSVRGISRKLALAEYNFTDVEGSEAEKSSHLAVYSQDETGKRALYRHFVRIPSGAICELAPPGRAN